MVKKITIYLLLLTFFNTVKADEGMWLPLLLKQLNESDLQKNGLKISVEDIYSINKSSLKDAIVLFGGGCTAEVISDKGLILTNHHCAYGSIQSHSSVQNDILTKGFWAMSQQEELPNPGLTATFIVRMEDVTAKVLTGVTNGMSLEQREKQIKTTIDSLQKEAAKSTAYDAFIRPFFYGNEYYLFLTETFKDIRLVGAPPSSIGKFGGDTDNWIWPRHTGDFSVFRIYANKENKPADYSKDNVPYKPNYVIPISLNGIEKDDFTMVYGFPGKTTEYLTSYGVDLIMNQSDPDKVKVREIKLGIMDEEMKKSDVVRIQYAAKYSSIANYYKKWQGEINGLKKANAVEQKQKLEQRFVSKITSNTAALQEYGKLLSSIEDKYKVYKIINKQRDYYAEAIVGIEALSHATHFYEVVEGLNKGKKVDDYQKNIERLKINFLSFFKNYDRVTDQRIAIAMLQLYAKNIDKEQQPDIFKVIEKKYKGDFEKYINSVYAHSVFVSEAKLKPLLNDMGRNYKKIKKDPLYQLMYSCFTKYVSEVRPQALKMEDEINYLNAVYVKGLREVLTDHKYYPDANHTLRLTYGKVEGYNPKDAIYYNYYTTLSGMMEKEGDASTEFYIDPKLKELYLKKDYGKYADKSGELRIAFCASNHTTGGNSGSPVLNAYGQLIGTNFDRNWEGTMSDIIYNPAQVRNITVDVRYVLFVIDKFAGAGYLIDEMKIVK